MLVGGEPVGRLFVITVDQPWTRCRFEPLDSWESVRELFERHNEAGRNGFPPDQLEATKEILDRGVELRPSTGLGEPERPFMIYVEGDSARFRP